MASTEPTPLATDLTQDERRLLYASVAEDLDTLYGLLDYINDEMTVLGRRDRRMGQIRTKLHGIKFRLHAGYRREYHTSLTSPFFRVRNQETDRC